ncbi:hypothetical protein Q7P37_001631 [Cladosporium fusiforme]
MAPSSAADDAHIQEVNLQRLQGGQTSIYFASTIAFLILIFAIAHWSRRVYHRLHLETSSWGRVCSRISRPLSRYLLGQKLGSSTILPEHVALAVVYFGVNIGVSVWDIDWHHYTTFANRLGWVSLCNMMLAILLALKNTPLSPIAGRSYEMVNVLHRWCGYTTVFIMTVHTILYAVGLMASDYAYLLTSPGTIAADVAGIAMILMLLTANGYVRRRHYELFYFAHVALIVTSLITVCYHTSKAARHSLYMALIATSLYMLDRAIRLTRFLYYLPSNTATLTPLPSSNATRVTLSRSMSHAAAGSHAFLYIPSIRICQTHPFTMVNRNPVEFVISARDGFTNDLYKAACEKPGRKIQAGIEGPYGSVPRVSEYDRVVLFAGGSGATFAFALAVEWAKHHDVESKARLELVWSIRTAGMCPISKPPMTFRSDHTDSITPTVQLSGFKTELSTLESHPRITLRVHMTKAKPGLEPLSPVETPPATEKQAPILSSITEELDLKSQSEKAVTTTAAAEIEIAIAPSYTVPGRPDVLSTVGRVVDECSPEDGVLVAACGPTGLADDVRAAVQECTRVGGPSVKLHLEAFGW